MLRVFWWTQNQLSEMSVNYGFWRALWIFNMFSLGPAKIRRIRHFITIIISLLQTLSYRVYPNICGRKLKLFFCSRMILFLFLQVADVAILASNSFCFNLTHGGPMLSFCSGHGLSFIPNRTRLLSAKLLFPETAMCLRENAALSRKAWPMTFACHFQAWLSLSRPVYFFGFNIQMLGI